MKKMLKNYAAVLVFILLIIVGVFVIEKISLKSAESETQMVKDAVHKAVLTCYAIEGEYPESLDYLLVNYGLSYDEDRYIVDYDRGDMANVFPSVTVLEVGRGAV